MFHELGSSWHHSLHRKVNCDGNDNEPVQAADPDGAEGSFELVEGF